MTRTLKRIAPLQLAKILGVLYGGMGLIFLPFAILAGVVGAFAQPDSQPGARAIAGGMMLVMGLCMPVFYGLFGFIFGAISAALYNLVARWVGGIEVEVE